MYNPINMEISDEKRLLEKDLKERMKKKRYEIKYDVETEFHKRNFEEGDRKALMSLNKIHPKKFTQVLERSKI
jgi:hypothetical protein